ncbi:MAG TPA: hypothetical protein VF787_09455 [Thermoanaerobaculia bacterium]
MKRFAPAVVLLAVAVALYRKAIRLWWTFDDPFNLRLVISHDWSDAYTATHLWPQKLFTPLLFTSHELLLQFAGLKPDHWYRVQIALIAIAGIAVYFALRLFIDMIPALCGAVLFIAGPPLCAFATQLMVMHYLIAVIFGAAAVALYTLAFRRQSLLFEILSALCYFVAMLAKEIAIPLPLLLFFLHDKPLRVRVRHLLFHALAVAGFFLWRRAIIGTLLGGYGWVVTPADLPGLLITMPWRLIALCAGSGLFAGLVAISVMGIGAAAALRTRRAWMLAIATLFGALIPLVPVAKELQPRFALAAWLWICVIFAVGAASLRIAPRVALFVVAICTVVVANRQEWIGEYATAKRMSDEARTYMKLDGNALLRKPLVPPAAMGELQWLKETHMHGARGAGWFYDDYFLCGPADDGKAIYEYIETRKQVVEVTARIPDFARAFCASIRDDAPLRAEFHHQNDRLFWRFGPYEQGKWTAILGGGVQAFEVPRVDGFYLPNVPGLSLRIRYDSPEGWVTYSPEIVLDFAKQPDFTWHR